MSGQNPHFEAVIASEMPGPQFYGIKERDHAALRGGMPQSCTQKLAVKT